MLSFNVPSRALLPVTAPLVECVTASESGSARGSPRGRDVEVVGGPWAG